METKTAEQQLFEKVGTDVIIGPDSDLIGAIELALGIYRYNDLGWSNSVICPFCGVDKAATCSRDNFSLVCHAGCVPSEKNVSYGKKSFGYVDTAKALGIIELTSATGNPPIVYKDSLNSDLNRFLKFKDIQPSTLLGYTKTVTTGTGAKNGQFQTQFIYHLADIEKLIADSDQPLDFRPPSPQEIKDTQLYKALAYCPTKTGNYKRADLASNIGMSISTTKRYDKLAHIAVLPNILRKELHTADEKLFLAHDRGEFGYNVWLESLANDRKYVPSVEGFRLALSSSIAVYGKDIVVLCVQRKNTYIPPNRSTARIGLPVQWRRSLIKQGHTNFARLIDILLLRGVKSSQELTAKKLVEISGFTRRMVYRILESITGEN